MKFIMQTFFTTTHPSIFNLLKIGSKKKGVAYQRHKLENSNSEFRNWLLDLVSKILAPSISKICTKIEK